MLADKTLERMIRRCSFFSDQPSRMNAPPDGRAVRRGSGARSFAEVAGGRDKRLAEVVHPDAIHDHAGGQRVVRGSDRVGQIQPAAAVDERRRSSRVERSSRNCRGTLRPCCRIAADEDPWLVAAFRRRSAPSPAAPLRRLHRHAVEFLHLAAERVGLAAATCTSRLALGKVGRAVAAGEDDRATVCAPQTNCGGEPFPSRPLVLDSSSTRLSSSP